MIAYEVPLEASETTYNKKPLMYAALGNQKNHMAIYLCGIYCDEALKRQLVDTHKRAEIKLDMGASCIRFKHLDQVCLPAIAQAIAATPMSEFIKINKNTKRK